MTSPNTTWARGDYHNCDSCDLINVYGIPLISLVAFADRQTQRRSGGQEADENANARFTRDLCDLRYFRSWRALQANRPRLSPMTGIPLSRARILLIISGGIAAYKSLELIRRLKDRGATVQVVMTAAARQFVSPLSAATLSGQAVRDDLFSLTDEAAIGHIELSRAADLIVVAPATANILARMAAGLADDMATTVLLATDKRVLAAPAMNVRMWLHPATRRNLDRLKDDGVLFVGPESGPMACGEFGPGRMAEPPAIVEAIEQALAAEAAPNLRSKLQRVIRVRSTDGMLSSLRARPMSPSTP